MMRGSSEEILYGEVGKRGADSTVAAEPIPVEIEEQDDLFAPYKDLFSDHDQAIAAGDWELQEDTERDIAAQFLDDVGGGRIKSIVQAKALAHRINDKIYI